ncbi:substrate-binding domain-containing protein, partial [Kaarinaea lacus]
YTRIFPEYFEILSLDGSGELPPLPGSNPVTTTYYAGVIGDGGKWGRAFVDFLQSKTAQEIYTRHGLTTV